MKFDQERVINFGKNSFLGHDMLLLIFFYDVFFLQHFKRVQFIVSFISDKNDLRVGTFSDLWQHNEVINSGCAHWWINEFNIYFFYKSLTNLQLYTSLNLIRQSILFQLYFILRKFYFIFTSIFNLIYLIHNLD